MALIQELLRIAVTAPSGDNCQPWRFDWNEPVLSIWNRPDRDASLYNARQRGSHIANGALIENIRITAPTLGLKVSKIQIFPKGVHSDLIANISFIPQQPETQLLSSFIAKRATNRKRFTKNAISPSSLNELMGASRSKECEFIILENSKAIETAANAVAQNDLVLFGNQTMHDLLFGLIRWQEKEPLESTIGLPTRTLEVPSYGMPIFRLMRSYTVTRILLAMGISRILIHENAKTYRSCGAIAALTIENDSPESMVSLGQIFQRLWLTATAQKLQFQPLMGIVFLQKFLDDGNSDPLTPAQIDIIKIAHQQLRTIFSVPENRILGAIFRIGYGEEPSERTGRDEPELSIIQK